MGKTLAMRAFLGKTMMRAVMQFFVFACLAVGVASSPAAARRARTTLSLDGMWQIADSAEADHQPQQFGHTVPVPGLAHSALPAFPDVDKYVTRQLLSSLVSQGRYSAADYAKLGDGRGISQQKRNYFWYRKAFKAPARAAVALLKINKAQFGTAVYLNGIKVGDHLSCFTAVYLDVSKAIRWDGPNELIIRIGAHPGVLPSTVSGGTDFEKNRWTPGIYDSVSVLTMDNPVIATTQVAPHLASAGAPANFVVQTQLANHLDRPVTTTLAQQAFEWKSGKIASTPVSMTVTLDAGETKTVTQTVPLPAARLWSPEDPFLYTLRTETAGDAITTRFGMREFRFDTVTQRAYLNGRPYFLRGGNIAFHRFLEDPQSSTLPWNDAWVKRLLVTIPHQLHWNSFRFTIGPVPERWLEIADENGLLIQNEYAVWTGSPIYTSWRWPYDPDQMKSEYAEWMRDGWNHPSVVIWDATNESWAPDLTEKVLPAVRGLDLSNRAWENSYNEPGDVNDPLEDHTYFEEALQGVYDVTGGGRPFKIADLEGYDGPPSNPFTKSGHAKVINEYGWLWLNRDGSPTLLTSNIYPKLLGDRLNTTSNRRQLYARLLGGQTELWRAYRRYAGVMMFPYLSTSAPDGFTSDQFIDLQKLTLEPLMAKALEQAFKPLGVYLNFWQSSIDAGTMRPYTVFMVNDEDRARSGKLTVTFTNEAGRQVVMNARSFALPPLGAQSYTLFLASPQAIGRYTVKAVASADGATSDPTISVREVAVVAAAVKK